MTRLVEIWSERSDGEGCCGSGWVLGDRGVLTARHVVAGTAILQVRRADAQSPAAWVDAAVRWQHPTLDVAIVAITPHGDQRWERPAGPSPPLAGVGTRAVVVNAIGFPDAAVRPDGLRSAELAPGRLLPAPHARDPELLMACDVDVSVPDQAELWKGISGAGVLDEHERLVAIVVKVHPDRQQRRLRVLAVQDVAMQEGFGQALSAVGVEAVVEDRRAPMWRTTVSPGSLTAAGVPARAGEIEDLGVLGVHAAVAADTGSDAYGPYVTRDNDRQLAAALQDACDGGRRLVLVVGDSAAGKSRAAAHGVRCSPALSKRQLVVPRRDQGEVVRFVVELRRRS
jgi:hypothetical protein